MSPRRHVVHGPCPACKHCGQAKPGRMRGKQCYDCLNLKRRTQYAHDPEVRQARQLSRTTGQDPAKKAARQRAWKERNKHTLYVKLHLPQQDAHINKETQPVILPDWFWYLMGRKVLRGHYNPEQVNPSSYDTLLADKLLLQRYRGREYPNTPAHIYDLPSTPSRPAGVYMEWRDPQTGIPHTVRLQDQPFMPGDSVLAKTVEKFYVPRFVRLQGMLKSSVAREGVDSRSALYVDPKFPGNVTLELHFDRSGYLVPNMPLVQFEAQLCLSLKPYSGHYVGQEEVTPNRNKTGIGFRSVV